MRSRLWLLCAVLAACAWGNYGVAARGANESFHHAAEYTFILVCLAYTAIGIPGSLLPTILGKDHGVWRRESALWGIGAGLAGALGALCVVWAIKAGGISVVIMALVFGLAQVFNFLFTWALFGLKQNPNWKFGLSFAGLVAGSAFVQLFRPGVTMATLGFEWGWWLVFSLGTAVCWGCYGMCARTAVTFTRQNPANPQEHGSHFQPLFWVSGTYCAFGLATLAYIALDGTPDVFNTTGAQLGFLTGFAGLAGAAFVIPANSVKGSPGPGVVMAVVFATASVVNAFANTLAFPPTQGTLPWFYVAVLGLALSTYFFTRNNPTVPAKKAPPPAAH